MMKLEVIDAKAAKERCSSGEQRAICFTSLLQCTFGFITIRHIADIPWPFGTGTEYRCDKAQDIAAAVVTANINRASALGRRPTTDDFSPFQNNLGGEMRYFSIN